MTRFLLEELSTRPVTSPATGFTYRLDPALGSDVRSSASFGPFFLQRSLTVGAGQVVVTNGGKTIQFADGPGSTGPISFNTNLQGTPDSVSGPLPGGFFLQSSFPGIGQAAGIIPFTLNRTYNNNGIAIYSLPAPATGTGHVTCPDGTSGDWSITIPATTAIMKNTSGDFMMPVQTSVCGGQLQSRSNYTGLANLNFAPNGISLVLHLTGYFIVGT